MIFSVIRNLIAGQPVNIWTVAAQVISILFIIICVLPFHELAHGWVAGKLGDPTAKLEGRLTWNPLASVDTAGALALLLFGFGWAKPVPVDPRYFKKPRRDMALTALAGPAANLLAALVGALLVTVIQIFAPYNGFTNFLFSALYYYVVVNISLAVFNLIPAPPLDGSRILSSFLSYRALDVYYRYQNLFVMLLFFLMFTGALSGPLYRVQSLFANAIFFVAELPFRLFGLI